MNRKKIVKIPITNLNHYLSRSLSFLLFSPRCVCLIQDVIWHRLSTIRFAVAAVADARWDKDSENCLEITSLKCGSLHADSSHENMTFLLPSSRVSDISRRNFHFFARHFWTLIEKIEIEMNSCFCWWY